jgi:ribosomal subunit interface protein
MKTNIKTTGIELTDALSSYVDEKITHIEKVIDESDESVFCDVEIGTSTKHHQSGEIFRAEINLHTAGKDYRAVSEKDDLYTAINDAKEQIMKSAKQHRSRIRTLLRRGSISVKKRIKGFKKPYTTLGKDE